MSWSEVRSMAVKKVVATKTSSMSKPASSPKVAPKTPAPPKSNQPATAKAQPATAQKAPAVKLSDAQGRILSAVHQTKEAGYLGNKAQAKSLDALLQKKMIKRGKKEGDFFRFLVTKAGEKHVPAPSVP